MLGVARVEKPDQFNNRTKEHMELCLASNGFFGKAKIVYHIKYQHNISASGGTSCCFSEAAWQHDHGCCLFGIRSWGLSDQCSCIAGTMPRGPSNLMDRINCLGSHGMRSCRDAHVALAHCCGNYASQHFYQKYQIVCQSREETKLRERYQDEQHAQDL